MRGAERGLRRAWLVAALALGTGAAAPIPAPASGDEVPLARRDVGDETVVLLHGLWRSGRAMRHLAQALEARGYDVRSPSYPSTRAGIEDLTAWVANEVEACCRAPQRTVHFVTHSLGGILVRAYLAEERPPRLGRVVMLAPPNHGTVLVDGMRDSAIFRLAGPAASELGTGPDSIPQRLGPVDFELGVLAAGRSWNPLGSWLIPGPDDGTVAVESTRVEGMADFRVVDSSHSFIVRSDEAADEVIHFLQLGRFSLSAE